MNDVMVDLTLLSGIATDMLWGAFFVFLRVGAALALLPAFGEQSVPQRVRLVLTLAFTAIVAPAVGPVTPPENGLLTLAAVEIIVGLGIGISLRMFVMALQIAGAMIAQATSLSQVFGGAGPEPQPAIGNLLVMAGLALAVATGLHVHAVQFLILSYQLLPVGQLPQASDMADWGLDQVKRAFSLGFMLAMPFTVAALLYNIALGVINRAMPALMVSFIGAPALSLASIMLMAVVAPAALLLWSETLQRFLSAPFSALP